MMNMMMTTMMMMMMMMMMKMMIVMLMMMKMMMMMDDDDDDDDDDYDDDCDADADADDDDNTNANHADTYEVIHTIVKEDTSKLDNSKDTFHIFVFISKFSSRRTKRVGSLQITRSFQFPIRGDSVI